MNKGAKVAAVVAAGALVAGCSSLSGTRAKNEELNTRLANLEGQVTSLSQRVDELTAQGIGQPAADFEASTEEAAPARSAKRLTVRQTQRALASAGFYKGPIDGKEGPQTKRAIRAFQQAKGLRADGIVGNSTRRALAKYLEEPQE